MSANYAEALARPWAVRAGACAVSLAGSLALTVGLAPSASAATTQTFTVPAGTTSITAVLISGGGGQGGAGGNGCVTLTY
ncbi:hypothetical protein [Kitasatospora sp. NPDC056731]|uniref:hypothetical protein n=1 Tax=Kitasatospora sp. NPDC056731 TaxID=3155422 RepID=UPI00343B3263